MQIMFEGEELFDIIRTGCPIPIPDEAVITIISGRGANADRVEIIYSTLGTTASTPRLKSQPATVSLPEEDDDAEDTVIADPDDVDPFA